MSFFTKGTSRRGGETYPVANRGGGAGALENRYLVGASPAEPAAFISINPSFTIIAAVNVARTASGIFMVTAQMPAVLSAPDQQLWSALALAGGNASGGDIYGDWLIASSSPLTTSGQTAEYQMGLDEIQCVAGALNQSMTLVGVNSVPLPEGESTIIVFGTTVGGTEITPGAFFGVAYELP